MKIDKKILVSDLTSFYIYLRDSGFSVHSNQLKSIISAIENNQHELFMKIFRSSIITGGAGSLLDLDFRDKNKNEERDMVLKKLKAYKKTIKAPFWKFWGHGSN